MVMYDVDNDCLTSEGRPCNTLYGFRNDVFLTETLKGALDDADMPNASRQADPPGGSGGSRGHAGGPHCVDSCWAKAQQESVLIIFLSALQLVAVLKVSVNFNRSLFDLLKVEGRTGPLN